MNTRFQDLIKLDIPPLLLTLFDSDITDFPLIIQDNIIEIQCNDEYKAEFKAIGYFSFWIKYGIIYPAIWKYIKLYLVAFPTSYLVERGLLNYLSLRIYYNIMYLQVLALL